MCGYNDVAVGIHKFKDSVRTILMIYKFTLYRQRRKPKRFTMGDPFAAG